MFKFFDFIRGEQQQEAHRARFPQRKYVAFKMSHPDVDWSRDVGVHWGGFASILAESILRDPTIEGRMGGPNYAVVSRQYMNLSSRLGYHFAAIDTYCGRSNGLWRRSWRGIMLSDKTEKSIKEMPKMPKMSYNA